MDWLSIAVGNIHGAISAAKKTEGKIETMLDMKRIDEINRALGIPLVLHGGTGVRREYILGGVIPNKSQIDILNVISKWHNFNRLRRGFGRAVSPRPPRTPRRGVPTYFIKSI